MGLLTRNSEKNGSLVRFSSAKACSRPNWRRKPLCHSMGDRSAGAWVRESLGSFFAVVMETTLRRVDFIGLHLVQELPAVGRVSSVLAPLRPTELEPKQGWNSPNGTAGTLMTSCCCPSRRQRYIVVGERAIDHGSSSDMLGQTGFGGGLLISWAAYQAWSESRVHSRSLIVPA